MTDGLIPHPDHKSRCWWPGTDPLYVEYHDTEWGVPEYDDRALFEKLILDGFQAGLSWITILRKRENFRRAFADFDPAVIARFDEAQVEALMLDPGIVRNRAKIVRDGRGRAGLAPHPGARGILAFPVGLRGRPAGAEERCGAGPTSRPRTRSRAGSRRR